MKITQFELRTKTNQLLATSENAQEIKKFETTYKAMGIKTKIKLVKKVIK